MQCLYCRDQQIHNLKKPQYKPGTVHAQCIAKQQKELVKYLEDADVHHAHALIYIGIKAVWVRGESFKFQTGPVSKCDESGALLLSCD